MGCVTGYQAVLPSVLDVSRELIPVGGGLFARTALPLTCIPLHVSHTLPFTVYIRNSVLCLCDAEVHDMTSTIRSSLHPYDGGWYAQASGIVRRIALNRRSIVGREFWMST